MMTSASSTNTPIKVLSIAGCPHHSVLTTQPEEHSVTTWQPSVVHWVLIETEISMKCTFIAL